MKAASTIADDVRHALEISSTGDVGMFLISRNARLRRIAYY